MPHQYFTTSQAAKVLHVTRFTVLNWIKQGKIKAASTFGGHHRIPKSSITSIIKQEEFINQASESRAEIRSKSSAVAAQKANISRIFKRSAYVSGRYIASIKDKVTHILA
ncbi:MAG: helix-turn-helix domain-containing protein [Candidatus Omnitrophica bacterium]|nr:helix-turn-helix domain-containing protein [Candidatus Omnitrophota bacterium]